MIISRKLEGVDKRIDVLATAIYAGLNAVELKELDLAYALSERSRQYGSAILLDVRTEWEYENGHIEGVQNIPVDNLREHLEEIKKFTKSPLYFKKVLDKSKVGHYNKTHQKQNR